MSLNWKEIDLILDELDLAGAQIQNAIQCAYDIMIFRIHKKQMTKNLLVSIGSGACRIHETFRQFPKNEKKLRFAQFLNSKIVNGYITEAVQFGDDRIVRITVKRQDEIFYLYIRLWSNAANFIVTDSDGVILDAMRRLPKRGELTGGRYLPSDSIKKNNQNVKPKKEYEIRQFEGDECYSKKIDDYYSEKSGSLSLDVLRDQARLKYEGSLSALKTALEKLREKKAEFDNAEHLKNYGDLILSNMSTHNKNDKWLNVELDGVSVQIALEQGISPAAQAGKYYEQYRKAKNGITQIEREITDCENEIIAVNEKLSLLLEESNPLILAKLLKTRTQENNKNLSKKDKNRPGLSFLKNDWLIIVGRDSSENDELLRRYVNGNDVWLHARDYHGSYVFIKQRSGKTIPLDILLDAGNLAIFYSKGRNNNEGDLFYTQVKYLRRVKNVSRGKTLKGKVIPTQEKNLHVKLDENRLRLLKELRH